MADVNPIPKASVTAATQVNAGLRISARSATRRSPNKNVITYRDTAGEQNLYKPHFSSQSNRARTGQFNVTRRSCNVFS